MNIHPSFAGGKPRVSGDRGALLTAMVHLWPYVWPSDRRDLKVRVLVASALLLLAKLTTMAVPFTFKWATDALAHLEKLRNDADDAASMLMHG